VIGRQHRAHDRRSTDVATAVSFLLAELVEVVSSLSTLDWSPSTVRVVILGPSSPPRTS
jgi:hypothetical protein